MDVNSPKNRHEVLKRRLSDAARRTYTFLQTPLGTTVGGGLAVVLIARYLFGI
jgi:hypothetical protein